MSIRTRRVYFFKKVVLCNIVLVRPHYTSFSKAGTAGRLIKLLFIGVYTLLTRVYHVAAEFLQPSEWGQLLDAIADLRNVFTTRRLSLYPHSASSIS
jgi:hypothetical protein